MRRIMRLLITLTAVGVMFTVLSGNALASSSSHSWTRLGGDPLVREGVHNRSGFVRLITSGKGNTAMRYAGMSKSEIASAVFYARTGQFRQCSLKYGMHFQRMSFGINGTSVDRNVTFRDSRYRRHPASAWCMDVRVGNRTVHILVPAKCGNVAVKNRTRSPLPKPKIKKPKKTKTGKIVCGPNFKLVGGNCVQQAANAEQNCKAVGGSYNNQNGLCTIVQVVGNCSNIVVVNGSGNVVSANQGGNCNNNPPSAPPSPPSPPSPPPPSPPVTPPSPPTPPKTYSVSGSTSVQAQKSLQQACPPPNSSIVKTGTSDFVTQSSPVFTGTGSTQAAAQADLDSKLAAWRAQNQGAVDNTANNQAQQRLGQALLDCPKPPPANKPPTVSIVGPQHVYVGGVVTYCASASDPDGDSLSYSFTTNYGSVVGSGNCYTYQAPMAPMNGVTVTVTVNDGKGGIASATTSAFPVQPDQF
jgi:hypothetical protein